jgi:DHA1 family bicyclomycin/chloramphenicol resistance-like MFS transporter
VRTRRLIPLLAACSAIGAVGNYLFLPALPQIGAYYAVLPGTAQLTVTAYLVSFAIGVLLSGPLADRFGRRPILIGGVALTGIGALLCYFAPTMSWFVAARVLQGAAGGFGITVSRACVGDLFEERELARMYAILTMALVLGTALAPYAGGLITRYIGWREAFTWMAALAGAIAACCYAWLPETRAASARSLGFRQLWRDSRILLARPVFLGYVAQAALIYALFLPPTSSACTTCSSPPGSSSATCWCRAPAGTTMSRARPMRASPGSCWVPARRSPWCCWDTRIRSPSSCR